MTYFQILTGSKVYLSPCQPEDAPLWTKWLNDPEVTLPLGDEAYELISLHDQEEMIRRGANDHFKPFSIVDLASDQAVGRCLLFNINWVDRRAMMGIFIGEKQLWNQGYGTEALQLVLDYAFNLLNLNSIELGVFALNHNAIHSYQKVGFKQIGIRRQFRFLAGKAVDLVLMDILAEEFVSPFVKPLVERLLK